MNQGGVSQTIINGTLGSPVVFSTLLMAVLFMLGVCVTELYNVNQTMQHNNIELRLLQVHVQDMNAVLLREGIVKPGDQLHGPTSGDH